MSTAPEELAREDAVPAAQPGEGAETGPLGPSHVPARRLPPPPLPRVPPMQWVALEHIEEDPSFPGREPEAIEPLAESLARHGQQVPVDLWRQDDGQLVLLAGHRRLAAVRLLRRRWILARIHEEISEEQARYLARLDDLDRRPWSDQDRARLSGSGPHGRMVDALLARAEAHARVDEDEEGAPVHAEAPTGEDDEEEEVDLDELADRVRDRLADACNDLSALFELWGDLDEGRREDLIDCVRYLRDMYPHLAAAEDEDNA